MNRETNFLNSNRNTRIHEAGHVVVARHFGYRAAWRIGLEEMSTSSDSVWVGAAAVKGPIDLKHSKLIALAGPVAEMILGDSPYEGPLNDRMIVGALRSKTYVLSDSDAEMLGSCTAEDVMHCCKLVRAISAQILIEADEGL